MFLGCLWEVFARTPTTIILKMDAVDVTTATKHQENNMNKSFNTVVISAAIAMSGFTSSVEAAVIDQVKSKVVAIKSDTGIVKSQTSSMLREVQVLSDMSNLAGPLLDTDIISSIVDGVQPVVENMQLRKAKYDDFNAEAFRTDLSAAVQTLADMQIAIRGEVGPGIAKLQAKLVTAKRPVLFALSETPLIELIELTEGLGAEIASLVTITNGAIADIESSYTAAQVARFASLGMSAAAPAYVSCTFVLDNVSDDDITNLGLIRLRMKQISGVTKIALEILPNLQTIGVNAVGGATLSIPNPVIPMVSSIKKVADKYYDASEDWTTKYDDCGDDQLSDRLDAYLSAQGL